MLCIVWKEKGFYRERRRARVRQEAFAERVEKWKKVNNASFGGKDPWKAVFPAEASVLHQKGA